MNRWLLSLLALCCVSLVMAQQAKPEKKAYLDPKEAGPDFAVQGEYKGKIGDNDYGAQVIAQGDGKFVTVFYMGGLPGAGWNGSTRTSLKAERGEEGAIKISGVPRGSAEIRDGKITGVWGTAGSMVRLERIERTSPTVGAKPPAGAVVLFDGSSAEEWKGGKLIDGNLLNNGITSKKAFKDFKLHLEFRLAFMPKARGQGRSNSGVYVQNRYEVQVLDSFGLEGKNNECGGVYQQSDCKVNMCLPPLVWQTYDIEFTAAKFEDGKKVKDAVLTVLHNGVKVQDGLVLKKETPGGQQETDTPGPFQLQNHGDPVHYRNIWVVETSPLFRKSN